MMAETIICFVILMICAVPLIILGIVQYRSQEPVGFWSGKKPPAKEQITDIKAYNQKHGLMWIVYGTGFVVCFLCGVPFGGLATGFLCMVEIMGGIFVMAAYHNKLNRMYFRKQGDM